MKPMIPSIADFLRNTSQWKEELTLLHDIAVKAGLDQDFKWTHPCYTDRGKNILLIHGFKDHCAALFPKGVLLKDPRKLLTQQTTNAESARQLRFTNSSEIHTIETDLMQLIKQAVEVERTGKKVKRKTLEDLEFPEELQEQFDVDSSFEKAFYELTPGRQKAYVLYINEAKQSATKIARVERNKERILQGYGMNDCTCGLSSRMPGCDGSHRQKEDFKRL